MNNRNVYSRNSTRYRQSRPRRADNSSRSQRPPIQQRSTQKNTRPRAQRPSYPQPRKSKLPLIIAVLVLIALICIVRFVACTPHEEMQDATIQAANNALDQAVNTQPEITLTANEQDRLKASSSNNDVRPTEKVCYLTFDDGPSGHTEQILDTLDEYGIKATWFVIGDTGHLDKVNEIWDRGNQIGLHSYNHDYEFIYADPANFVTDINKIGSAVNGYLGFTPTLIRYPGGSVNGYNTGRASSFKQAAVNQGWHYFDWNVSIGDSTQPPAPVEALVENIKREAEGCNSVCVLMHDSDFKPTTPDALPQIIEYFKSEGYTFDVLVADSFGYQF